MLDSTMQRLIAPLLRQLARPLLGLGVRANTITLAGFVVGLTASAAIALRRLGLGLLLLLLSRLFDGLDGAVARVQGPTDWGGFLDITLDFIFYASVPLGFALADPGANALAACWLLLSFVGTGSSFLAYAALAAKLKLESEKSSLPKSLHFIGGLTEATETLVVFALMCLFAQHFSLLAYIFASMCWLTVITRLWQAYCVFGRRR